MKKILIIHPSSEMYGSDKILVNILNILTSDNNCTLIVPHYGPLIENICKQNININILYNDKIPLIARKNFSLMGFCKFLWSFITFNSFLKRQNLSNPDILYLNTLAVTPISFFFKHTYKVIHVHEILKNSSLIHKIINTVAVKFNNKIICVSEAVNKNLQVVSSNKEKEKIITVHNGITFNDNFVANNELQNFKTNKEKINFALIGRIKPQQKGQILLIHAIAKIPKELLEKSHFYFIGSTVSGQEYMYDEINNEINKFNLNNYITLIPFIKNIEIVYNNIDVSIVPSLIDDSFPTTVLESMYFSKPVIGSNMGGIPEMIVDKETGFIFQSNNGTELSNYVQYFIMNPDKIKAMGNKGKNVFNAKFTLEKFNQKYNKILSEIQKQ